MIRRALDDAIACESLMPSESFGLRADYAGLQRHLEGRDRPGRHMLINRLRRPPYFASVLRFESEWIPRIADAWLFWRREPERSRRVWRLAVANWLAYYDLPPDRRPPPAPGLTGPFDLYALGPEAPAGARALSPRALDRWLATTTELQAALALWDLRAVRLRELAASRDLVISLASQLYRRDHGRAPDSEQDLVGPYLKSLPDDGLGDPGDADAGGGPTRGDQP
jgi:hypothetical protein